MPGCVSRSTKFEPAFTALRTIGVMIASRAVGATNSLPWRRSSVSRHPSWCNLAARDQGRTAACLKPGKVDLVSWRSASCSLNGASTSNSGNERRARHRGERAAVQHAILPTLRLLSRIRSVGRRQGGIRARVQDGPFHSARRPESTLAVAPTVRYGRVRVSSGSVPVARPGPYARGATSYGDRAIRPLARHTPKVSLQHGIPPL